MPTWFTSDEHWVHRHILEYEKRPFESVAEMNEALIDKWNKVVRPNDTVFNLGDMFFTGNPLVVTPILERLNGKVFLILGNHDAWAKKMKDHPKIVGVEKYYTASFDGQAVFMCHYPMLSWDRSHYGIYHFHGHVHSRKLAWTPWNSLNVGVDNWDYTPINMEQACEKIIKNRLDGTYKTAIFKE